MTKEKVVSFEESLQNLESIVQKLEQGEVPLEDAIHFYQEGMKYSKICHDKLKEAETQIAQVLKENGELERLVIREEE